MSWSQFSLSTLLWFWCSGHRSCMAMPLLAESLAGITLNFKIGILNMESVNTLYILISEIILSYLY